ncbi:MAG: GPW/gp25 family protein [Candidatus Accumulibacter sp.]|jgi:phage baseplate assembly protein W|nr:GPW/gp25 family protein [Accumulibacter sp.]
MSALSEISALHWQPALGRDGIVEDVADIDQAIRVILRTPRGAVPHRPEFGSNLHLYLDYPVNRVVPHLARESYEAIRENEPRCTLVKVTPSIDEAHIRLVVRWKLADGVLRETLVQLK